MRIFNLGSSSSGNMLVVCLEGASPIILECGFSQSEMDERYMKMPSECPNYQDAKACIITHGHKDHCKGARSLAEMGIRLYGSSETLESAGVEGIALESMKAANIGNGIALMPFRVSHDFPNSYGYVIKSQKETIVFVNDSKGWDADLSVFKPDYVLCECNHWARKCHAVKGEAERVMRTAPLGSKEYRKAWNDSKLIERNLTCHMSLESLPKWLKGLDLSRCKALFLLHPSDRYLDKLVAKEEIHKIFGIKTYVCLKEGGLL